jgi:DNA modification methylase
MVEQTGQATYFFKLRHNIALDGDLVLARLELEALLREGAPTGVAASDVMGEFPQLGVLEGPGVPTSHVRRNGVQIMVARGPLERLPELIRRPAFVQRIYCLTADSAAVRRWLEGLEGAVGRVVALYPAGEQVLIEAVPHYALCELAGVVMRPSAGAGDMARQLPLMVDGLLNRNATRAGVRIAERALAAQATTAHLSHDLHTYKAKFFPRLARSLLNICAQRGDGGMPRVLDPFVGSGTTLLEASLLEMPSVGLDIDPLSVLISRVKLEIGQMDSGWLETEASRVLDRIDGRAGGAEDAAFRFPSWLTKNRQMTAERARMLGGEIRRVQAALAVADPQARPLFRVLLSDAIARRIRMRFLGTGVGRFSLTLSKKSIPELMERSLRRCGAVAATFEWLRRELGVEMGRAEVVAGDARRIPERLGAFDVVITSPPYLPASSGRESYARARAPSLIALGMEEPEGVDGLAGRSIGSMGGDSAELERLRRGPRELVAWLRQDALRGIKAEPTARYFLEMEEALREMERAVRPGGVAVVVSGKQSTFYSASTRQVLYVAQSAEWLADLAAGVGFEVEGLQDIQLQKANPNARPRSLDDYYETLIMLRKPG